MKKPLFFFALGLLVALPIGVFAGSGKFSDISLDAWYKSDVESLANTGIVTGYSDGTFQGEKPVTRAEVSVMMNRLITYFQKEESKTGLSDDAFYAEVKKGIERYIDEQEASQKAEVDSQAATQNELAKNVPDIKDTDHVYGSSDARYVLFTYTDIHCPFCQRFHPTAKEFVDKHSDSAFVLRFFPLTSLHPESADISAAAECVAKVGGEEKFWNFIDRNFEEDQVTSDTLSATINALSINETAFNTCYDNKEFTSRVEESLQEATKLGIRGTPASILKDTVTGKVQFIGGAYPLANLESALEELKSPTTGQVLQSLL